MTHDRSGPGASGLRGAVRRHEPGRGRQVTFHAIKEPASALLGMYEGIANGLFTRESVSEQRSGTVSLTTAIERLVAAAEPCPGGEY